MPDLNLRKIAEAFRLRGDFVSAAPYGTGHINDSFAVVVDQGGTQLRYLLQRINQKVFRDPPKLMRNIERVTEHSREKLLTQGQPDVSRRTLTIVPTQEGASYCKFGDEDYWRAYIFIEKARSFDSLQAPVQAYEAAKAFGNFQRILSDLPGEPLHETIPDFHNGPKRFQDFLEALNADVHNRAAEAREEIDFLQKSAWVFDVLPEQVARGAIPVRITHNDTKINNVLIDDETGEGICVIDLDTLMPGLVLYDFGDMVRTSTCKAAEDERDLGKVFLDLPMFEQVARGYLTAAGDFLTSSEKEHLVFAGKMITLIIGCRFLTDYLNGDTYFKTHREGHNLDRCRTQFRLVQSITEQEKQMNSLVELITPN
jgi:aminoglycoside phosphotransferase (APT) family kinase protein